MTEVYEYLKKAKYNGTPVVEGVATVQALDIVDIGGFTYTTDLYFPKANNVEYPQPLSFRITEPSDRASLITCGYQYADQSDFTYGEVSQDELMWLFESGIVPRSLRDTTAYPDLASLLKN